MMKRVLTTSLTALAALPAAAQEAPHTTPAGAPNILIIMLDDAGFAQSDTVGGEVHTPTFSRIAQDGVLYNAFHTTAISSATRAALLTGRNHHRVGNGTVTEAATGADGYTGIIPPSAATLPQTLKTYGYSTAAFGKWHNTPVEEENAKGPFDHWPTGYGFDHFYGFLGGESDQYRPHIVNDTTQIEPPNDPHYHFSVDIADQAIKWIDDQHKAAPDKPFFLYWTPGAVHAPHQVPKEWADKYKGKFDSGWDAYRQRAFERQKQIGWIPADALDNPRPAEMQAWDSLSTDEKAFHAREMEVYAGFLEQVDTQAGRVIDEIEHLGLRDNTLIFYVFSDNGASSEGMQGSIADLTGLNGITVTGKQNVEALNQYYGGLDALGGPQLHAHYSAAWAWAGESPFVGTKLTAGYFGGTRTPLAVSWPSHIKHDATPHPQFHHVNDIAPTIYDVLGITPPASFNNVAQLPMDGVSMAYSFNDANLTGRKPHQYFEIMGSRAEVADGWAAAVLGPRKPWVSDTASLVSLAGKIAILTHQTWIGDRFGWMKWKPENDVWSLYDLSKDYSEAIDVANQHPEKLAELRKLFDQDAKDNKVLPIGESFQIFFHPRHREDVKEWHLTRESPRQLEIIAPNIKGRDNRVTVEAELGDEASGVLFADGGTAGGVTLFLDKGILTYEYNGFGLVRSRITANEKLPAGPHRITVDFKMTMSLKRGAGATATLSVDGKEVGKTEIPFTATVTFTADETFDIGEDTATAVSLAYFDRSPFRFDGVIKDVHIEYR
jgi:arylsulfatase A-like enzyme